MMLPKQVDQKHFMGNICVFNAEYVKTYLKKKVSQQMYSFRNRESIPVRWNIVKHKKQAGWIVGFGYVYNGTIHDDDEGRYFAADKRINYVRVRVTPGGNELKIPLKFISTKKQDLKHEVIKDML